MVSVASSLLHYSGTVFRLWRKYVLRLFGGITSRPTGFVFINLLFKPFWTEGDNRGVCVGHWIVDWGGSFHPQDLRVPSYNSVVADRFVVFHHLHTFLCISNSRFFFIRNF